ncbi:DsbA family protein [Patescibacteria group bacterium]|nr:DsbA family protein [Patescibacteria group bacterium]
MKNLTLLLATVGGTLALVVGVAFLFSNKTATPTGPADQAKVVGQRNLEKLASDSATLDASTSAQPQKKIVLSVFSDFQCPACANLEKSFLINARTTYADQVEFVYRHFPLDSIHPYARMVAWASEAAREEGKFWEFHDLVFAEQSVWSSLSSKDAVKEKLIEYASQLNIDKEKFIARMESDEIKKRIETDVADGYALNVDSTPTIYLNNNKTAPQDLANQVRALLQQ